MREIESIGILGAGQMGAGIAQVAAAAGLVEKGKLSADAAAATTGRITPVAALADLGDCDLVVEAVTEHVETKLGSSPSSTPR
jgi:3-hydroxybutyryl-CoA dehydrogenase